MKAKPDPGTVVRMTGKFLRNTGQQRGMGGQSRWTVQACDCVLCGRGEFVATDQPSALGYPGPRHIAFANLEKVRVRS